MMRCCAGDVELHEQPGEEHAGRVIVLCRTCGAVLADGEREEVLASL